MLKDNVAEKLNHYLDILKSYHRDKVEAKEIDSEEPTTYILTTERIKAIAGRDRLHDVMTKEFITNINAHGIACEEISIGLNLILVEKNLPLTLDEVLWRMGEIPTAIEEE